MWGAFKALSIGGKLLILVAILALFGAVYYGGYSKGKNISALAISKYEGDVKSLQNRVYAKQVQIDVQTITKFKDRVAYVDRVVYKTHTVVKTVVPEQFNLSKGWINSYNKSVLGSEPTLLEASNATPSSITDKKALLEIIENNGICLANQAQLDALQQWIKDTEASRQAIVK